VNLEDEKNNPMPQNLPETVTAQPIYVTNAYAVATHQPQIINHPVVSQPNNGFGPFFGFNQTNNQQSAVQNGTYPMMVILPQNYPQVFHQQCPEDIRLFEVYSFGKYVKIFALIDILGILLNGFVSSAYIFFIFLPMPICGVLSARNYKVVFVWVYAVFVFLEMILRIALTCAYPANFFFGILYVLVDLYILHLLRKFVHALKNCSFEDLQELRTNVSRFRAMDKSQC